MKIRAWAKNVVSVAVTMRLQ